MLIRSINLLILFFRISSFGNLNAGRDFLYEFFGYFCFRKNNE